MKKWMVFVPLALLTLAALACGSGTSSNGNGDNNTVLYRDNFSDNGSGWCTDGDDTSALDYKSGKYVFDVTATEWFVWCNPDENFNDVHLEVTAENSGGTGDTYFGLMCHFQNASGDFYYAGITPNGDYIIYLYQDQDDVVLAEGNSNAIDANASSYKLGMDCANGKIALYVDGDQLDSASDDTYTSGDIGLFAWTLQDAPAQIRYDDLVVTEP